MKTAFFTILAVTLLTAVSAAKELPEAPSSVMMRGAMVTPLVASPVVATTPVKDGQPKVIDNKFIALAIISTGSTLADSYTTLFARQNWLAGKQGVCNAEVQSAYLYGTHPTVGRAYAVATVKSVGALAASYYLRKHHSKFWSLPLVANSIIGLQGTTQNMMACN
jgi:hypothetical protein